MVGSTVEDEVGRWVDQEAQVVLVQVEKTRNKSAMIQGSNLTRSRVKSEGNQIIKNSAQKRMLRSAKIIKREWALCW
jgi:hypothetical protein